MHMPEQTKVKNRLFCWKKKIISNDTSSVQIKEDKVSSKKKELQRKITNVHDQKPKNFLPDQKNKKQKLVLFTKTQKCIIIRKLNYHITMM